MTKATQHMQDRAATYDKPDGERGAVSFDWLNHTHSRTPANWTEEDEARQSVIMQNGNDGLHYEYRVFITKLNERTLNAATPHNFAK